MADYYGVEWNPRFTALLKTTEDKAQSNEHASGMVVSHDMSIVAWSSDALVSRLRTHQLHLKCSRSRTPCIAASNPSIHSAGWV